MTVSDEERAERYLRRNPDASAAELAGAVGMPPSKAKSILDDSDGASQPDNPEVETGQGNEDALTPSEHYERLDALYSTLGEIDGSQCPGYHGRTGWYHMREDSGQWNGRGRVWALGREFPGIREEMERTVYATVNYASADWFMDSWQPYKFEDGNLVWKDGDKPMPDYGDLKAYAPFADIDLADEVKQRRPDGDIPQETVEEALRLYLDAFADLAGGKEHVYALDSVGGAYAFVAPTATAPIADALDAEERGLIFEDMRDRLNEWLDGVKDEVTDAVPDSVGTFEPDLVNNKNRAYKAPMSIHKSLDGVVTPLSPETPSYEYTPLEDVDGEAVAEAEAWADAFTSDHTDAVGAIVATLWPDYHEDADGWQDVVSARVADLTEEREQRQQRSQERLSAEDLPDDIEETDEIDVVNAAIEAIDCRDVARQVAAEWDTAPGRDPPRFDPSWRISDTGTSCYADADKYVDLKEGTSGGGPLKLVARASGIIGDSGAKLRGEDYWKAVNELRRLGYEIPRFTGSDGTHPDALELLDEAEDTESQQRQAVRAMRASKRSRSN